MQKMDYTKVINKLKKARVLVIGDLMLDKYVWCSVARISPEAPVPVAVFQNETNYLGGAANVANNARALGAHVSLMGIVGDDEEARTLRQLLKNNGIDQRGVFTNPETVTTTKRRVMAGTYQICRIDKEGKEKLPITLEQKFLRLLVKEIKLADVVVVSDYAKGIFTEDFVSSIMSIAKSAKKKVFVDSKGTSLMKYKGAFLIKPNKEEAERATGERFISNYENLESVGRQLVSVFDTHVLVTLGRDGMALFTDGTLYRQHAFSEQQVFDVSGAGDTVLSVIATVHAVHSDLKIAVDLANMAANHVVGCLGISVCDAKKLRELASNLPV